MRKKINIKDTLIAVISLGAIVPLWGTFHPVIGVSTSWPAFASASVFFAAEKGIPGVKKIALGHILGFLWGVVFLHIINLGNQININSNIILFCTLSILAMLAVMITSINIEPIDHLPSLFSGWAITVGGLGGIPVNEWNLSPLDILLSIQGGIFIIGVGVSVLQYYMKKKIV